MVKNCTRGWASSSYWSLEGYWIHVTWKQFNETYWKRVSSHLIVWTLGRFETNHLVFTIKIYPRKLDRFDLNRQHNIRPTNWKLHGLSTSKSQSFKLLCSCQTFREERSDNLWHDCKGWIRVWSLDHRHQGFKLSLEMIGYFKDDSSWTFKSF